MFDDGEQPSMAKGVGRSREIGRPYSRIPVSLLLNLQKVYSKCFDIVHVSYLP